MERAPFNVLSPLLAGFIDNSTAVINRAKVSIYTSRSALYYPTAHRNGRVREPKPGKLQLSSFEVTYHVSNGIGHQAVN